MHFTVTLSKVLVSIADNVIDRGIVLHRAVVIEGVSTVGFSDILITSNGVVGGCGRRVGMFKNTSV